MFLTFFINTIKAIYDNADILRASIASAGNDHRLGANEAPPAIISAFIGSKLTELLDELEQNVKEGNLSPEEKTDLKLNIGKIPEILLDNTDRNRTSPFAFTGNKFEFRAVGSSANCSSAMIALNTIVAKQLKGFTKEVDALIEGGTKKDEAILIILQRYIKESKDIRFEGNGYGDEWVAEAEKRGLSNLRDTPSALKVFASQKAKDLFSEMNVLTDRELEARHEIELENYTLKLQIESRLVGDLAQNHIIPSAITYQSKLVENVSGLINIFGKDVDDVVYSTQKKLILSISENVSKVKLYVDEMLKERKEANLIEDAEEKAFAYCNKVKPYFDKVRYHADKLETLVDDELWPLPKLRELLFTR